MRTRTREQDRQLRLSSFNLKTSKYRPKLLVLLCGYRPLKLSFSPAINPECASWLVLMETNSLIERNSENETNNFGRSSLKYFSLLVPSGSLWDLHKISTWHHIFGFSATFKYPNICINHVDSGKKRPKRLILCPGAKNCPLLRSNFFPLTGLLILRL